MSPPQGCGEALRSAREQSGLSLQDVSQRLKMPVRVLQALEAGQWDQSGGAVFVRGQLRSYGRLLKLDVEPFLAQSEAVVAPPAVLVARGGITVPRLFVSDMDSTMIGQECIDELADFAGLKERIAAITERAMQGELDFESALRERVGLLRDLPEEGGEAAASVLLPVSKASIASRLSMTPEYFSKVLRELEDKGLIEVDKREIRLLDTQRLARYPLK